MHSMSLSLLCSADILVSKGQLYELFIGGGEVTVTKDSFDLVFNLESSPLGKLVTSDQTKNVSVCDLLLT